MGLLHFLKRCAEIDMLCAIIDMLCWSLSVYNGKGWHFKPASLKKDPNLSQIIDFEQIQDTLWCHLKRRSIPMNFSSFHMQAVEWCPVTCTHIDHNAGSLGPTGPIRGTYLNTQALQWQVSGTQQGMPASRPAPSSTIICLSYALMHGGSHIIVTSIFTRLLSYYCI